MPKYNFNEDQLDFLLKRTKQRIKNKSLRRSEEQLINEFSKMNYKKFDVSLGNIITEPYLAFKFDNHLIFSRRKFKKYIKSIKFPLVRVIQKTICINCREDIEDFFNDDETGKKVLKVLLDKGIQYLSLKWPVSKVLFKYTNIDEQITNFLVDIIAEQLDKVFEKGVDQFCKI